MQVQVTGKHVDVGEALRSRVTDELSNSILKYFYREGGGADVVVSREGNAFKVDCSVVLASGQQLTTHGLGGDAHVAFDAALEKMSKRVRRYKARLKDHHGQAVNARGGMRGRFSPVSSRDPRTRSNVNSPIHLGVNFRSPCASTPHRVASRPANSTY